MSRPSPERLHHQYRGIPAQWRIVAHVRRRWYWQLPKLVTWPLIGTGVPRFFPALVHACLQQLVAIDPAGYRLKHGVTVPLRSVVFSIDFHRTEVALRAAYYVLSPKGSRCALRVIGGVCARACVCLGAHCSISARHRRAAWLGHPSRAPLPRPRTPAPQERGLLSGRQTTLDLHPARFSPHSLAAAEPAPPTR